ncbi:unnamed protein product [Trichobilharzia szidati]|nr:unnamed protein product [Trichobilharzia szidati]
MDMHQKFICDKLKTSGWDFVKYYENSSSLISGYSEPIILAAQQYLEFHITKLEVSVILLVPYVDYMNKKLNLLSVYNVIGIVEKNRTAFLNSLKSEYGSALSCHVDDKERTNFSVKLGCYDNDGMFILINASCGLSSGVYT